MLVTFIGFVVAILSSCFVGYSLGHRRGTGYNREEGAGSAGSDTGIAAIEHNSNTAVQTGTTACQTIQDVIAGIRRRSDRSGYDDSTTGDK